MNITKAKHFDAFKREWKEEEYILEVKKNKGQIKWLNEGSFPVLDSTSVYSKTGHKHHSYPRWYSLSARSVLLDSCSSSQPRCADSFMLCFCAISKTMFSSSSSSILFLSVSRSCARHTWMKACSAHLRDCRLSCYKHSACWGQKNLLKHCGFIMKYIFSIKCLLWATYISHRKHSPTGPV